MLGLLCRDGVAKGTRRQEGDMVCHMQVTGVYPLARAPHGSSVRAGGDTMADRMSRPGKALIGSEAQA
ncbi:hypothetical protein M3P21_08010 [Ruegeria sp. 2012CJ41-6]|uniref:Uncharacterized protein n=1 Tax=Ruegeria spongiae TaxID=2942209 RepID=A0ABT0Q0R5_9RHOB|nr:hypothetical protein [Ruegeria spongiae]MCL6283478.1 hypothetical protein [Ruegeria spongiae]